MTDPSGPDPAPSHWQGGTRPRRPLGLAGALLLLTLWIGATAVGFLPYEPGRVMAPLPQVLATGLLFAGIGLFRWSDVALGTPVRGTMRLMWLPWLYLLLFTTGIIAQGGLTPDALFGLTAIMIWIAISEEVMFRGLLYPALRRRMGPWAAIWLTSLAFGAVHLGNGLRHGDYEMALAQSLAAVSTGLLLLALRLRRGSIWPAVVYHALWDIGSFGMDLAGDEQPLVSDFLHGPDLWLRIAVTLAFVAPNGLYALWLLRKVGHQTLPGDVPGPERAG